MREAGLGMNSVDSSPLWGVLLQRGDGDRGRAGTIWEQGLTAHRNMVHLMPNQLGGAFVQYRISRTEEGRWRIPSFTS
jgi:hypothetical protein